MVAPTKGKNLRVLPGKRQPASMINVVRITLGRGTYRSTHEVDVKSNVRGWMVMDAALDALEEELFGEEGQEVILRDSAGDELGVIHDGSFRFVEDLVIGVDIMGVKLS